MLFDDGMELIIEVFAPFLVDEIMLSRRKRCERFVGETAVDCGGKSEYLLSKPVEVSLCTSAASHFQFVLLFLVIFVESVTHKGP